MVRSFYNDIGHGSYFPCFCQVLTSGVLAVTPLRGYRLLAKLWLRAPRKFFPVDKCGGRGTADAAGDMPALRAAFPISNV